MEHYLFHCRIYQAAFSQTYVNDQRAMRLRNREALMLCSGCEALEGGCATSEHVNSPMSYHTCQFICYTNA